MGSSFVLVAACSVSGQERGLGTKGNLDQDGFSCIFFYGCSMFMNFSGMFFMAMSLCFGVYTGSMKQFFGKTTL